MVVLFRVKTYVINPNNAVIIFDRAAEFVKFDFEEESSLFIAEDGEKGEFSIYADIGNATICYVTNDIKDFLERLELAVSQRSKGKHGSKKRKRV
jgi:hypothetical protein